MSPVSFLGWLSSAALLPGAKSLRPKPPKTRHVSARLILEPLSERILLSFYLPVYYPVGSDPSAAAVGDFNGDGIPDLAVANRGDNTVSILLGNGDGTFQDAMAFPTGSSPSSIAVADLNGDGKLDIVTADSGSNTVSVLLGNGDGTFRSPTQYVSGLNPVYVAVGHFRKDGPWDIAVANFGDDTISILLGNGDGTFRDRLPHGVGRGPRNLVLGDFNNDGVLDVAVPNTRDFSISVLLGNGDGTFQRLFGLRGGPVWLAGGDVDNDGNLDLVDIGRTSAADNQVLLGNGNGTFRQGQGPCGIEANEHSVEVGDFNNDGNLDVVLAGPHLWVQLGNGDGSFQCEEVPLISAGLFVTVADLNADGFADLVAGGPGNSVAVVLNDTNWPTSPGSVPPRKPGRALPDGFEVPAAAVPAEAAGQLPSPFSPPVTIPSECEPSPLATERQDAFFAATVGQPESISFFGSRRHAAPATYDDLGDPVRLIAARFGEVTLQV